MWILLPQDDLCPVWSNYVQWFWRRWKCKKFTTTQRTYFDKKSSLEPPAQVSWQRSTNYGDTASDKGNTLSDYFNLLYGVLYFKVSYTKSYGGCPFFFLRPFRHFLNESTYHSAIAGKKKKIEVVIKRTDSPKRVNAGTQIWNMALLS